MGEFLQRDAVGFVVTRRPHCDFPSPATTRKTLRRAERTGNEPRA